MIRQSVEAIKAHNTNVLGHSNGLDSISLQILAQVKLAAEELAEVTNIEKETQSENALKAKAEAATKKIEDDQIK